jgi:hypothetical protein
MESKKAPEGSTFRRGDENFVVAPASRWNNFLFKFCSCNCFAWSYVRDFVARTLFGVTLVQHRTLQFVHFFLDFIFQSLNTSSSCNKTSLQIFP